MSIGETVTIRTQRPHITQYNGLTGRITGILGFQSSVAYVQIGQNVRPFYIYELEATTSPVEGGAA